MASRLIQYLRGQDPPEASLPDTAPAPPPKTRLQRFVTAAYFAYTAALVASAVLYGMEEERLAAWIVLAVASLHFVLGGALAWEGSVSIAKRYEWENPDGTPRGSGFRGGVTLLSDFIVMPAALAASALALRVDEDSSESHFLYGVAVTAALVGNGICNVLHLTE